MLLEPSISNTVSPFKQRKTKSSTDRDLNKFTNSAKSDPPPGSRFARDEEGGGEEDQPCRNNLGM